jgi:hypothetical protein
VPHLFLLIRRKWQANHHPNPNSVTG